MSSLGCNKEIYHKNNKKLLFICGVPNAWGKEHLCFECEEKLKIQWFKEEKRGKIKNDNRRI